MMIDDPCAWAHRNFGPPEANSNYVDVLVAPSRDHLVAEDKALSGDLLRPLVFLAGLRTPEASAYAFQYEAGSPSISVVMGTYGLGKTELMHQLCHYLNDCRREYPWAPCPLLVNLALCIERADLLREHTPPSGDDFAALLFGHAERSPEDRMFIKSTLLPAIASGKIFLILDGLDELVSSREQYRHFVHGLANMLRLGFQRAGGAVRPQFRIATSMRYEYLSANDEAESDLVSILRRSAPGGESLPIWFMRLDLFDDSRVQYYMDRRLGTDWFPRVQRYSLLLEVLYRPLLLRVFCDMVGKRVADGEEQEVVEELSSLINATSLIARYVEWAARDSVLKEAQRQIESAYRWDLDKLATNCLRVFLRGKVTMGVPDLRQALTPDAAKASEDDVWRSVHKCPFLRRKDEVAHFTHRPFLEYFVAKGVTLDLEKHREEDFSSAFDTLVLNVDTRKFLKSLVLDSGPSGEKEWYRRTAHAYGFDDPGGWPDPGERENADLDTERRALLDAMTEPENSAVIELARSAVKTFLERNHDRLHPRYLIPNLEAVAIFIRNARSGDVSQVRRDFGAQLLNRLETTLAQLEGLDPRAPRAADEGSAYELLVERILSVALRLRYPWVQDYTNKKLAPALKGGSDASARIETLLKDIKNTLFPKSTR